MQTLAYLTAGFMLVISLAVAIWTGRIAERKGYNFLLFVVIGFVFGIFGLGLSWVLPTTKVKKAEEAVFLA